MVDERLAAMRVLNQRSELVLPRSCIEITHHDEVGLVDERLAIRVVTCEDGNLLESREEREGARGLVGHDYRRLLGQGAEQMPEAEGAADGIAVGTNVAREHDPAAFVDEIRQAAGQRAVD